MTSRSKDKMDKWIAETQMFQRIAKVEESSYEELSEAYFKLYPKTIARLGPLSDAIKGFRK
jgi:hypothetical protein